MLTCGWFQGILPISQKSREDSPQPISLHAFEEDDWLRTLGFKFKSCVTVMERGLCPGKFQEVI